MNELLALKLIEGKYVNLDMKGLIGILLIFLITALLLYGAGKLKIRIIKITPKWELLTKNAYRIIKFLLLITAVISILELLGISVANYMKIPLIKTEKILVTPSRTLFIFVLIIFTWALSNSLKTIYRGQ